MTRASFDAQRGPNGALLIGSPNEVVDKILRHSDALVPALHQADAVTGS